jgi:hypothetical protein
LIDDIFNRQVKLLRILGNRQESQLDFCLFTLSQLAKEILS